ncbi:MAG: PAS domain S-box protein [Syntrophobacterales bacterium]
MARGRILLQEGNNQFWEEVMNTIMEGVVVLDPRGVILAANQAMEDITGYHRQELIGKPCALIKSDTCFDALKPGKHCELFQNGSIRRSKCSLARKDGSLVHVLKTPAPQPQRRR